MNLTGVFARCKSKKTLKGNEGAGIRKSGGKEESTSKVFYLIFP
jgi:hypothetical protein